MTNETAKGSPLHDDLVEMLEATREAERAVYALLDPAVRDAPRRIGEWSATDVLAHLAAWRAIEAERLRTGRRDEPTESEDEENARIQAERAGWGWQRVAADAEASIDALEEAIRRTPAEELGRSDRLVAGIGGNGANHAIAHLSDVASLAGDQERYRAFADRIEAIVVRGRLPARDAAVMLYNVACNDALTGRLDDARRLLVDAFRRRPDLLAWALEDSDLTVLRSELGALAGA